MLTSTNNTTNTATIQSGTLKTREPKKELDKDDFLNLMVTQLKNQDPLNPMDNSQFIAQTTQMSSLEQLINIAKTLESQSINDKQSQFFNGASFIGKNVKYHGSNIILKNGQSDIQFNLSNDASKVTVSILDSSGKVVANAQLGDQSAGVHTIPWDGTGLDGKKVPDGSYTFQVKAFDAKGNEIATSSTSSGKVTGLGYVNGNLVFNVNGFAIDSLQIVEVDEITN